MVAVKRSGYPAQMKKFFQRLAVGVALASLALAFGGARADAQTTLPTPPPSAWQLLVYSLRLLPISEAPASPAYDRALAYRTELAEACAAATDHRTERYICIKVARWESFFREDVGRCAVIGKANDRSAWQIVPRNASEEQRLCKSLVEDARFHVERVRESRGACRHLPKQEQLALYARGDCASEEGRKLSRFRFPTDNEIRKLETETTR